MEPSPPFLHRYLWNPREEIEIAVKATPIFNPNFIGRHDPLDSRYVKMRFGLWSFRTGSRHQIYLDRAT